MRGALAVLAAALVVAMPAPRAGEMSCPAQGAARMGRDEPAMLALARDAAAFPEQACNALGLAIADYYDLHGRDACSARDRLLDFDGDADLLAFRGWLAWRCGAPRAAHGDALASLARDERATAAWTLLGQVLAGRAYDRDAAEAFRRALAIDPDDPVALLGAAATAKTRAERIDLLDRYVVSGASRGESRERLRGASESAAFARAAGDRRFFVLERAELPADLELDALAIVPGRITGLTIDIEAGEAKRLPALFDTGASGLHIDERAAKETGFEPLSAVTLVGGGGSGEHDAGRGVLESLDLGPMRYAQALGTVAAAGLHPQGAYRALVGADLFGTSSLTLDARRERLTVEPSSLNEPAGDPRAVDPWTLRPGLVPLLTVEGMLLVPAVVQIPKGPRVETLLLLDTGAARSFLDVSVAVDLEALRGEQGRVARGYGGDVPLLGQVPRVDIIVGGVTDALKEVPVFSLESRARVAGVSVGGFLGLDWLEDVTVTIDLGRATVHIEDAPSRARRR